jgi:hypothetical protein
MISIGKHPSLRRVLRGGRELEEPREILWTKEKHLLETDEGMS